jgi:hypothetical protein
VTSPLRQSRANALRLIIGDRHGELVLDRSTYRVFAEDGWSHGAIDRAVDDLVELGDVAIVASAGRLCVRSLGTEL